MVLFLRRPGSEPGFAINEELSEPGESVDVHRSEPLAGITTVVASRKTQST